MTFYHEGRDLSCVVHGDDFTFSGLDEDLDWIQDLMQSWFEIKVRARLGPDAGDDKEVTILGRIVRWMHWGIECEADPRHRQIVLEHFGFNGKTKALDANGAVDLRPEPRDEDA